MKELDEFYAILKDPVSYGRKMKEQGRKIVGYFCSYTPEEIIYAAGAHPFRIFAAGGEHSLCRRPFPILLLLSGAGSPRRGPGRQS